VSGVIQHKSIVIVVDDDLSILRALHRLISTAGFEVLTFDRPSELLKSSLPKEGACLVIDIDLPEMNGIDLHKTLASSGCSLPFIFITGHTDGPTRTMASSANPVALLSKPFRRDQLLNAIGTALRNGSRE